MPTGISRVVGEKPRRLAPRLAVQVTNATNLARVISEVRGLVIRQQVSESLTRYGFAVGRYTLILQGFQRLCSKGAAKRRVEALERAEILGKIERNGVDCFLGYRGGNRGHWRAALDAAQVPFTFNSEMPDDHIDRVRLREDPPVDLLIGEVVE